MTAVGRPNTPYPYFLNVLPKIGITMGDPTGIGPEIIIKALSRKELFEVCRPVVFGDEGVLLKESKRGNVSLQIETTKEIPEEGYQPGRIFLFPSAEIEARPLLYGKPDRECGEAMVRCIQHAVTQVKKNKLDAITTCPINKQAIHEAGYRFAGHTELLAYLAGVSHTAMMFVGSKWKVVLVTTHLPLIEVSKSVTCDRILNTLRLTEEGLKRYFGISPPRIAVLGLNPHCGEEGILGEEEKREIVPAIEEAKTLGMEVEGPFPADSFFEISRPQTFDAVIAMYHDQGLIPIKMLGFKESVNVTLGLPFVRTSVAHGTAYDIAGKGLADPVSLINAVITAANLSKSKREF